MLWEGRDLVVRYKLGEFRAMMKRTLVDELTMTVRVMCDDFDAVATYQMLDPEGDLMQAPYRFEPDAPSPLKA